jgi:hypothetical protein
MLRRSLLPLLSLQPRNPNIYPSLDSLKIWPNLLFPYINKPIIRAISFPLTTLKMKAVSFSVTWVSSYWSATRHTPLSSIIRETCPKYFGLLNHSAAVRKHNLLSALLDDKCNDFCLSQTKRVNHLPDRHRHHGMSYDGEQTHWLCDVFATAGQVCGRWVLGLIWVTQIHKTEFYWRICYYSFRWSINS